MPEALPRRERDHEWLGAHLFCDGDIYSEVGDRVVLEVVAPLVERWVRPARRWFFIRYREDGPHIRLRIFGPPAWLESEMRPAIEQVAASSSLIERLRFVEYEPEIERYGGPHGVVLAEELFHHSSETALALLNKIGSDRSARFGKALLAMLVLLHLFAERRDIAAEIAKRYGSNYLRAQVPDPQQQEHWLEIFEQGLDRQADRLADYAEAAWEALVAEDELTAELDDYRGRLQEKAATLRSLFAAGQLVVDKEIAARWPAIISRLVSSYLHMMNNRLGVSSREECYLSILIYRVLGWTTQEDI